MKDGRKAQDLACVHILPKLVYYLPGWIKGKGQSFICRINYIFGKDDLILGDDPVCICVFKSFCIGNERGKPR